MTLDGRFLTMANSGLGTFHPHQLAAYQFNQLPVALFPPGLSGQPLGVFLAGKAHGGTNEWSPTLVANAVVFVLLLAGSGDYYVTQGI